MHTITNVTTILNHEFNDILKTDPTQYGIYELEAGKLLVMYNSLGVFRVDFLEHTDVKIELRDLKPISNEFLNDLNLLLVGTDFQIKIWQELLKIPYGSTSTYSKIAKAINHEKAHRAVASAIGQNKIAYFVPCHRVIRSNGELSGFRWGTNIKSALLLKEGA
ncbi:MAG: methylated-DNA--[protein]-cysteine S-methyltransferase [Sphingobacteriia bacterium]|nr:methylated-DNA--[protein]-cysteine S-methyltransferase [Sphingobacteriia bacterium]